MKKHLALLMALVLSLSACAAPAQPPLTDDPLPEQTQPVPEDIPFQLAVYPAYSLHPVLAENRANLALASVLYEPLFALNERFEAEMSCAAAISSARTRWSGPLPWSRMSPFPMAPPSPARSSPPH